MKESIGVTQLFSLVVTLVIIFAAIMALAINRANSFTIKDKIVNILEKHDGFDLSDELTGFDYDSCEERDFNDNALEEIVCSLQEMSYRQTGNCPTADGAQVVGYQRNGSKTMGNKESSFCIIKYSGNSRDPFGNEKVGVVNQYYYKVVVFYHLDLPVLRQVFSFRTMGETKALYQ